MQTGNNTSNSLYTALPNASVYQQVQDLRRIDGQLRSEAQTLQARANAEGKSVSTQIEYTRGPDGRNYVKAITVTRSATTVLGGAQTQPEDARTSVQTFFQSLPQSMEDIRPAQLPLTPAAMAQGFANSTPDNETAIIKELQRVDAEVRLHEALHYRAASGIAAGIADLEYMQGPDGQYYAVSGNVDIQTTATANPEKVAADAALLATAANAPGNASAQDMGVAKNAAFNAATRYEQAMTGAEPSGTEYNMVA
ncbi:MAG: hypothetical protein MK052_12340 [Alphaproteobacteria bacterium]|nr:hypothetical protein [Alphaproteobacteria bacterium]